uniref:B30.2/SPRY domain-containing protein n=1 Tax=Peronospora matthiolae TaxID=2874970 RepID=A0AAV1T2W3_9STRA
MPTCFSELGDELLANVLSFAAPRDVESATVASSVVARDVIPQFSDIWKNIFLRRWEVLNFPLHGVAEGETLLQINEQLDTLFPSSCTDNRKFQLLAHAIVPVPSYADVKETQRNVGYLDAYHRIISLQPSDLMQTHTVDFALDGQMLGNDRCVRSNMPFLTTPHVAVYKHILAEKDNAQGQTRPVFEIGIVSGGYFELSLRERQHRHARVSSLFGHEPMTSIGLVDAKFPLVGKQPGWTRRSYGYHGDDGRYYHGTAFEGRPFGSRFKAGSTVGCGIWTSLDAGTRSVFFSNNGELISTLNGAYIEVEHRNWYPAVGLDSYDALHVNFGQEPFAYSNIADRLIQQCNIMGTAVIEKLQWYSICDSDGESTEDGRNSSEGDSGNSAGSDMSDDDIRAGLIVRILAMRQAGMDFV